LLAKKFVYNVAGRPEWEKEIKDYSDLVLKAVGRDDSIVTYEEAELFTTKVKTIDCSKAVKDLKHNPKVTPEEGIRRTVEWMKSIYYKGG
jgi:dTDP-glucose 4,6-dehydratase